MIVHIDGVVTTDQMGLNIDDINTVNDLLNIQQKNEEKIHTDNVTDHITEQILEADPSVGLEICARVLYALREFHASGIDMYIHEGKADFSAQWACDHTKLNTALELIKDIQL